MTKIINAVIEIKDTEDGEHVCDKVIYDGSKQEVTIMRNGVPEKKLQGIIAVDSFKEYVSCLNL